MHTIAPPTASPAGAAPAAPKRPAWRRPEVWLAVVAVVHAVAPIVLLGAHWAFGIDETIYLSQLNTRVPAEYFSAPRARGSTLIAAPVTLLTSSVAAVRIWVTLLSGLGLYLAFRPWLRLVAGPVVPLAAAAFASVWSVTYYGFEVMPNEWVAFAALAACGSLLRYIGDGRRRHLVVLAAAPAVEALLRPSDAVYTVAALAVVALLAGATVRRRLIAVGVLAAGTAAGLAEWVIEAQTSFGGLSNRIHLAQAEQGGGGPFWSLGAQARVLAGPLLCRGRCRPHPALVNQAWWVVLAVLVLVAVAGATRRRDRAVVLAPTLVGVALAAQYVITVPYGAPRFLIPTYALLSIPAIMGARTLIDLVPRRAAALTTGLLVAGLLVHAGLQVRILLHDVAPPMRRNAARDIVAQARALTEAGVRGDCLVRGVTSNSQLLSFALACHNGPRTVEQVRSALQHGTAVVYLTKASPARTIGGTWRLVHLRHSPTDAWVNTGRR